VNYVRDRKDAQVHILITSQRSGSGRAYDLAFFGQEGFDGTDQRLIYNRSNTDSSDDQRRQMARYLQFGMAAYVLNTPQGDGLQISWEAPADAAPITADPTSDPWNFWVFSTELRTEIDDEDRRDERDVEIRLSASRTTEQWRMGAYYSLDDDEESFTFDDGTRFVDESLRQRSGFNAVRSLSPRWSVGAGVHAEESTFRNLSQVYRTAVAVEYNLFPYSESAVRQLKFGYYVGQNWFEYNERSVLGEVEESRPDHVFEIEYDLDRRWGDVSLAFKASQFLDDRELYRLSLNGQVDYRITRGLSIRLWAKGSLVRDEIYLPAAGLSDEDILLGSRALDTDLVTEVGVSLKYTFGSIYNNVVNNRLDGGEFVWRIF
jgi:hypothetical protein